MHRKNKCCLAKLSYTRLSLWKASMDVSQSEPRRRELTQWKKASGENPLRASVRFPVKLAIHLRADKDEFEATTKDISANGLLFVGDRLPHVDRVIEFTIDMPSEIMGSTNDVEIHCRGRVVRHEKQGDREQAAAVIDEYYLKA